MTRVTYAQPVQYDTATDVREECGPALGLFGRAHLTEVVNDREDCIFRLEPGLMGWAPATHTLFVDALVYHVAVEEFP